jgi:hypothetical protein
MATTEFHNVWYRPEKNHWHEVTVIAMRNVGTLIVNEDSLEFRGKRETVRVTDVRRVSYGKQGKDRVNNWVRVEYGDGMSAYFADGSRLGWGGIFGGTKTILAAVRHLEPAGSQGTH